MFLFSKQIPKTSHIWSAHIQHEFCCVIHWSQGFTTGIQFVLSWKEGLGWVLTLQLGNKESLVHFAFPFSTYSVWFFMAQMPAP